MHFYVVSAYVGSDLYTFLFGIRMPGGNFVYIFMLYLHTLGVGAICMHFYMLSANLGVNLYHTNVMHFNLEFTNLGSNL